MLSRITFKQNQAAWKQNVIKLGVVLHFKGTIHVLHHFLHKHDCVLYRFKVPVCVSLAVNVGHRWHNLPEEHSGFLLRQSVFGYNVIKQLSPWAVLKSGKEEKHLMWGKQKNTSFLIHRLCIVNVLTSRIINICEEVSMTWYSRQICWWLKFFMASISNFTRGRSSCEERDVFWLYCNNLHCHQ